MRFRGRFGGGGRAWKIKEEVLALVNLFSPQVALILEPTGGGGFS